MTDRWKYRISSGRISSQATRQNLSPHGSHSSTVTRGHAGDGRISWRPVMEQLRQSKGEPRLLLEVRESMHRLAQTAAWLEEISG